MSTPPDPWMTGPAGIRLNTSTRRAFVGQHELDLTKTSFDILTVLLANLDAVVATSDLIRTVWGYEESARLGFAYTAVYRLRKELSGAGVGHVIESIRGVGFRIPSPKPGPELDAAPAIDREARTMLESFDTAILLLDRDRRIFWANPAAERLTGYSLDELRQLPSSAVLGPERQQSRRREAWEEIVRGSATPSIMPVEIVRRDGTHIVVRGTWKAVRDAAGAFLYALAEAWPPEDSSTDPPSST